MDSYSPLEVTETIASSRLLLTLYVQIHISDVYCSSASCEQYGMFSEAIRDNSMKSKWSTYSRAFFTCIPGNTQTGYSKGNPAQSK